eukprot:s10092_g1.t1
MKDLRRRIERLQNHGQVVILGDYNVNFSAAVPARVGDLVWPARHPVPRSSAYAFRASSLAPLHFQHLPYWPIGHMAGSLWPVWLTGRCRSSGKSPPVALVSCSILIGDRAGLTIAVLLLRPRCTPHCHASLPSAPGTADLLVTRSELRSSIEAAVLAVSADVVRKLRPLLGPPKCRTKGRQALPQVVDASGRVLQTAEEVEEEWIRHFSGVEAGVKQDPQDFVAACQAR